MRGYNSQWINKNRKRYPETEEQMKVYQYLQYRYPEILFTASPAGVKLPMVTAINMKRLGCKAGVPDILIFEPSGGSHGLMIEMKAPKSATSSKGTLSTSQKIWIDKLIDRGYSAYVCYGFDDAKKVIDQYFTREGGKSDRIY